MSVTSGDLSNDIRPITSTNEEYLAFLRRSSVAVEERRPEVIKRIAACDMPPAKWHPYGFTTFDLEHIADVGLLRLHVWPESLRRVQQGNPAVHNHSFHLYSTILAGEYRDTRYDVIDESAPRNATDRNGLSKKYAIRYGQSDGSTNIDANGMTFTEDTGEWARIIPLDSSATFPAGTWHEIEAGEYHSTPIAKSRLCATLVVMVQAPNVTDYLVGNPAFGSSSYRRPVVEPWELELICRQVLSVVNAQGVYA